jgi:hypothetical protein
MQLVVVDHHLAGPGLVYIPCCISLQPDLLHAFMSIFKFAFFKFLAISCQLFASFGNLDLVLKLLYHAVPHFGGHRLPFFPNA